MKTSILAAIALVLASGVTAAAGPVRKPPIRPIGDCMVARQVRDWGVVDNRRLVVRTLGNRYYDVELSHACRDLSRRPLLSFRDGPMPIPLGSGRGFRRGFASNPVLDDGRICGDLGESVIPHGGVWSGTEIPCRIASVRRIDKHAFDGVFGRSSPDARAMLDASPTLRPQR
jgi:hypothetical protein